jgi:two-component system, NarL family, nitrate/nitrite sensor histidine kinase NarX
MPDAPNRRSLVAVIGALMALVVGLGVVGMLSSVVIAQINQGMAAAVNQSGTLRMQSYRIAAVLADPRLPLPVRQARVLGLADEYELRLMSGRLTDALPDAADDPLRLAYERVRRRWMQEMRPAVATFAAAAGETAAAPGRDAYLTRVDDFVADIHALVRMLEERSERRIDLLRWSQAAALALTVAVVLVTLLVVQRRVVAPLNELLRAAARVRRGDFSTPARVPGGDELGRLGSAMNLMTDGLASIYEELEERVAAKTRDLARTNHSLELLYRTSRTLDEAPISEELLCRVLRDLRAQLGLAEVVLCLRGGLAEGYCRCIATGATPVLPAEPPADCHLCAGPLPAADPLAAQRSTAVPAGAASVPADTRQRRLLDLPVVDAERRYGLLRVVAAPGRRLESWQRPLLQSVAAHLATALALQERIRESRRLVLHEERSILARELHDSLAQSLSYMKIQAARLDAALRARVAMGVVASANGPGTSADPAAILAELRTGIASAYRQLRELLTTFRLRMDGAGLGSALADTVRELETRGGLRIRLRYRLPPTLLGANEEVHVLQIVREALSNVVQHARARNCRVLLGTQAGRVCVAVSDDGVGLAMRAEESRGAADPLRSHHGTTIMRERAESLGGELTLAPRAGGGTRVVLRFRPRSASAAGEVATVPVSTESSPAPVAAASVARRLAGNKALIASARTREDACTTPR